MRLCTWWVVAICCAACQTSSPAPPRETARSLLLVTIDTLRADRVGAYGLASARTPTIDGVARAGVRFAQAFATAPITLPSHASLLSGRYPPAHGSRHNGVAMSASVPTLATTLERAGFSTAAFVSAFPLDKRFGLARGFDVYDDELPRGADGRPENERPGAETVDRARRWLGAHPDDRFFLWVHLFEPHAPYGAGGADGRPALARYDDEVATADVLTGRLIEALGDRLSSTLIVVTADHGEAFGEHGEIGHSIFVYDTTLHVPLVMRGPGLKAGLVSDATVSLVDLAPTVLSLLGEPVIETDGISLVPIVGGGRLPDRAIYAESFAPLFDFGWASLRSVREGAWKYIAAPRPELYEVARDPGEMRNLEDADSARASRLLARVEQRSPAEPQERGVIDNDATRRLRALGYVAGSGGRRDASRPDPKDRIQLASRLATVMAGEVQGSALVATLEAILRDDPENPQAHLRLGYAELAAGRCARAEPHLRKAIALKLPSADAGLGLAQCLGRAGDLPGAAAALEAADTAEPGNPVVLANLGLLALERKDVSGAIERLRTAIASDPNLLEARFALARALAVQGRRAEAATEARTLLDRLPPDASQRAEVQRLLDALK